MSGTAISAVIDGITQISVVNTSITTAGRAGIVNGVNSQTDTAGLHLDNFAAS